MRLAAFILVIASAALAQPAPPLARVSLAWDYPTNQPLPDFALLWGTNRTDTGTNQTATVSLAPGLHQFTALAVRNGLESDPSNEVTVRVLGFTLERADTPTGPWTAIHTNTVTLTNQPGQAFHRVRVWQ